MDASDSSKTIRVSRELSKIITAIVVTSSIFIVYIYMQNNEHSKMIENGLILVDADMCIKDARCDLRLAMSAECRRLNKEADCLLPSDSLDVLEDFIATEEAECMDEAAKRLGKIYTGP